MVEVGIASVGQLTCEAQGLKYVVHRILDKDVEFERLFGLETVFEFLMTYGPKLGFVLHFSVVSIEHKHSLLFRNWYFVDVSAVRHY